MPIHKRGGYLRFAAAALFLALSAWSGAWLYARARPQTVTVAVLRQSVVESIPLEGLALRWEEPLSGGALDGALADGARVPAGAVLSPPGEALVRAARPGLVFRALDGFEALSPALLDRLDVSGLEALLAEAAPPAPEAPGRLVSGGEWYFAALADSLPPSAPRRCRLYLEPVDRSLPARLVAARGQGGRCLLILRLTVGDGELLSLRRCKGRLLLDEHQGLALPAAALRQEADGTAFVYALEGTAARRCPVELVYEDAVLCLAREERREGALREGSLVLVSGEAIAQERERMKTMSIEENVAAVRRRIAQAAEAAGRDPAEIRLVAACKMNDAGRVRRAVAAGVDICGENRVQEMLEKQAQGAYEGVPLHFIGHLQKNKVRQTVGLASLIHGVDSTELLARISRVALEKTICQELLLEVNIGSEQSKSGFSPEEVPKALAYAANLPSIRVRGLMTIPPVCARPEENLVFFHQMQKLFIDNSEKKYDNVSMDFLSMGMSGDYPAAIACGANLVRIGTAIFGARVYP